MEHQPITSAVYPKGRRKIRRTATGPQRKPASGSSLVRDLLGAEAVAELYRQLGMRPPEQRRRKRGPKRG